MILSQIVAVAANNVIGKNNTLPWHLPEDLKFFRNKTKGKVMIMGRKTFDSLPHPLKGRYHLVISRQELSGSQISTEETPVEFVKSLELGLEKAKFLTANFPEKWPEETFIVGGSEIFKNSFPLCDRIYLTRIYHDVEGDVFYPDLDFSRFQITEQVDHAEPFKYSFLTYSRL